jgi:hypothetical protein
MMVAELGRINGGEIGRCQTSVRIRILKAGNMSNGVSSFGSAEFIAAASRLRDGTNSVWSI